MEQGSGQWSCSSIRRHHTTPVLGEPNQHSCCRPLLPAGLKKPEERANLIAYLKKATA